MYLSLVELSSLFVAGFVHFQCMSDGEKLLVIALSVYVCVCESAGGFCGFNILYGSGRADGFYVYLCHE